MDIKAPFDKYQEAAGVKVDIKKIKESIRIIMSADIDYEFRTTVVPGIVDLEGIKKIAKTIEGAKRFCLQQFSPKETLNISYADVKPYKREVLEEMSKEAAKFVKAAVIRNE